MAGGGGGGGREVGGEQRKMSEVSSALQCPYIIHIVLSLGALADVC